MGLIEAAWGSWVLVPLWGLLVSFDERFFHAHVFGQPVVAAAVTGWILGRPVEGVWIGIFCQALWPAPITPGGNLPPSGAMAGVAGAAVASLWPAEPTLSTGWPLHLSAGPPWIAGLTAVLTAHVAASWDGRNRVRLEQEAKRLIARMSPPRDPEEDRRTDRPRAVSRLERPSGDTFSGVKGDPWRTLTWRVLRRSAGETAARGSALALCALLLGFWLSRLGEPSSAATDSLGAPAGVMGTVRDWLGAREGVLATALAVGCGGLASALGDGRRAVPPDLGVGLILGALLGIGIRLL